MRSRTHTERRGGVLKGCWLACILSAGIFVCAIRADEAVKDDDPFKAHADQPQKATTRPLDPNAPFEVRLPIDGNEHVTFGAPGCPVIVAGNRAWDVRQGTIRSELDGKVDSNAVTALSDDGKYFAAGIKSANQEDTTVRVWSTETGAKVFDIPGTPKRFVDLILISRNKYVILGGRLTPDFQVWDLQEGKAVKPIDVKADRLEHGKAAFSPDGAMFLAVVQNKLTLFKTGTGKPVTVMSAPRHLAVDGAPAAAPAAAKPPRVRANHSTPAADNIRDSIDASMVITGLQTLSFSPDGKEIAAVSTHPTPRLIVWDNKGKLLFDEPLAVPWMALLESTLQWLPDKSGWLVNGYLIDRDLKRPVVVIQKQFARAARVCIWDNEHLVGAMSKDATQLESYQIPWKDIRKSVALMHNPDATLLGPSRPVSISAEFAGQVQDAQTGQLIADALEQRLKLDGIKVAPGSDTVFHLRLSEAVGDTLPIHERQSPFDFRGRDTGRTITERKGSLVIELTAKGESTPLWRETIAATSARSFREEINDASVRKSMIETLTRELHELTVPYFVPKDEKSLALPVVIQ
ncbi:MAG: hypothetical protein JWP03_2820 [Phycisphaerales bacterium]|jgi:hypothetical protein|nr:hypothetical protein [Phycisphaerales bacterium]